MIKRFFHCCLLIPFCCAAVQPYTPELADPVLEPWRWRVEESLSNLGVLCMDEAEDGTLWFGNTGSIASYDGGAVQRIPFDEELLSNISHQKDIPWAKALLVLRDGNVLVLIGESLVLWSDGEWRVLIQQVAPSVFTAEIKQGADGTVWLLVPKELWRISEDLTKSSVVLTAPENESLNSFCFDDSGAVWVANWTEGATSKLIQLSASGGLLKSIDMDFMVRSRDEYTESQIVAGDHGRIWYVDGSWDSGLEQFDTQRGEWIKKDSEPSPDVRYSILKGRDGAIWTGGIGKLVRSSDQGEMTYPLDTHFQMPHVRYSFYEDQKNRLWLIGRIGYVYSVDLGTEQWKTFSGLNFQFEDSNGVLWFIDRELGVVSHDPRTGEWLRYGSEDGLTGLINRLIHSSHGLVWAAGSYGDRALIAVFNGSGWTTFRHPEFARFIEPNSLLEASDGTVWFGAGGRGLTGVAGAGGALQYRVKEEGDVELLKHHAPPEFPYYVTAMAQTPDNALWLGSTVVHRYEQGAAQAVPVPGLQGENSCAMVVDADDSLWVAKEHFGVCRRDGDIWRVFNKEDGVAGLLLSDLLTLRDGTILASSGSGISRFDGNTWARHAYSEWFGMSSRMNGLQQSEDGSIWLNYITSDEPKGFTLNQDNIYRTVRHRPETDPPDTRIVDYLEDVSQPGNTHITWAGHDLWSSTPLEELFYSWRLDGGAWSGFSHETSRTFLKLNSGKHVMEVRARDRAFNIDPTPAQVSFLVIAPIWKQAWFLTMVSVFSGLILFLTWLLIRTRERHLEERQKERETFLVKQQEEREQNLVFQQQEKEKNLMGRQKEREIFLVKQQDEREAHLKEMDRLKTGFFTNISHELRTPMTVISGRLEMISQSVTDEKNRHALAIVMRNAQRVSTLITQLLDFRKIEEGKIKVEATRGDVVPLLRNWISSLQVLAEQKTILLSLESVEACRGSLDFDKLEKIVTNLLSNAIKYTKEGGEVRVLLNVMQEDTEHRLLHLAVEDTGLGISQEDLKHIFDRFYRVSEESMAMGAGIGLNLTKELVDLLGGEIRVNSPIHPDEERPGTRFSVYLPMDCKEAETSDEIEYIVPSEVIAAEVAPIPSSDEPVMKPSILKTETGEVPQILIVEDDEDIRNFIVEGLEPFYSVETAENGAIGLQKAKEFVPDLVVTDVMMPEMDGTAMCRELKTRLETSHIPVVMLTAKAALESQVEGLKTGADDYVIKPFHMELLQVRIANLLESRRLLREKFCREYSVLTPKIPENTPESKFLEKALSVLEEHYSDWEFNRDGFAAGLHMTVRTLHRKLKAVADRTPADFISEFRMIRGAELLKGSSGSITDIAFLVGYDNSSNFARMFKRFYKLSPSEYRKEHSSS